HCLRQPLERGPVRPTTTGFCVPKGSIGNSRLSGHLAATYPGRHSQVLEPTRQPRPVAFDRLPGRAGHGKVNRLAAYTQAFADRLIRPAFRPEPGHETALLEVWLAALNHRRQTLCTLAPICAHQGTGCPLDCLSPLLRKRPEWVR